MAHPVAAVLFDLAGVLLDLRGFESITRMSGGTVAREEYGQFWASPLADALYVGRCSVDEFAVEAVKAFRLSVTPKVFLDEFRSWLHGPFDGAFELLAEVRTRTVVACLSNTNSLEVKRYRDELDLHHRFDHCFFSNEIQLRKPDDACYKYALQRLGLTAVPERVVFFDDSLDCVRGARAAGLQAYHVSTIPSLRKHLQELELLCSGTGHIPPGPTPA